MYKVLVCFIVLFVSNFVFADESIGKFSGRVAKINKQAGLVRVHIKFKNQKYLNKNDQVEFWDARNGTSRCEGRLIAKSNDYYLFQVKFINSCISKVILSNGAYLKFFSQDLVNNMKMGREVISILKKKYQVYFGKTKRTKNELDNYLSRMDIVNQRYNVLREKLEKERREQLDALESDRQQNITNLKEQEFKLYEIQNKLEQYSMNEDNFKVDKWSLDHKLYIKK